MLNHHKIISVILNQIGIVIAFLIGCTEYARAQQNIYSIVNVLERECNSYQELWRYLASIRPSWVNPFTNAPLWSGEGIESWRGAFVSVRQLEERIGSLIHGARTVARPANIPPIMVERTRSDAVAQEQTRGVLAALRQAYAPCVANSIQVLTLVGPGNQSVRSNLPPISTLPTSVQIEERSVRRLTLAAFARLVDLATSDEIETLLNEASSSAFALFYEPNPAVSSRRPAAELLVGIRNESIISYGETTFRGRQGCLPGALRLFGDGASAYMHLEIRMNIVYIYDIERSGLSFSRIAVTTVRGSQNISRTRLDSLHPSWEAVQHIYTELERNINALFREAWHILAAERARSTQPGAPWATGRRQHCD